jgi:hypothetical protein
MMVPVATSLTEHSKPLLPIGLNSYADMHDAHAQLQEASSPL